MGPPELDQMTLIWLKDDVRILMVVSLLIQILLTFLAPCRKRSGSTFLMALMWLLYLGADSVALYTISVISRNQDNQKLGPTAFWAPFLLLHLGGPDTITALALQDCELWHRHALNFVIQLIVTAYVFVVSFRNNRMLLPTMLMFIDGCIKYVERTRALYFASIDTFRQSQLRKAEPGPNYARLMEEYSSAKDSFIPVNIGDRRGISDTTKEESGRADEGSGGNGASSTEKEWQSEKEAIQNAYNFYEKFKGLLADSFLNLNERQISLEFFLDKTPEDALKIIQIELNLIYDIFYTKAYLLKKKERVVRFLSFSCVVASLFLFGFCDKDKHSSINQCVVHGADAVITYILLGGAIALEIFSFLIFLGSDWCIILANPDQGHSLTRFLEQPWRWLKRLKCSWHGDRRWSEIVSRYDLLDYCFSETGWWLKALFYIPGVKTLYIGLKHVKSEKKDNRELQNAIAGELKKKASSATDIKDAKKLCGSRGDFVVDHEYVIISDILRPWTVDIDYDESVFIWHVATDLCYHTDDRVKQGNHSKEGYGLFLEHSKKLSDYMLYLLMRQQSLVSSVSGDSEIRFVDTCAEAKKFLAYRPVTGAPTKNMTINIEEFCKNVFQVKTEVQPMIAKGDKSQSALFDACRLAKQLRMFKEEKWEIMFKVWVELMAYAATRCSPRAHVGQLTKGGELITIVWLMMAHFGVSDRFKQVQGFGWAKLVIDK